MSALLTLRNVFWATTTLCELVLIIYLIRGKLVRSHFWLFLYLCSTVLQSVLGVITYSLLNDFDGSSHAEHHLEQSGCGDYHAVLCCM